jgi:hypothetical protein
MLKHKFIILIVLSVPCFSEAQNITDTNKIVLKKISNIASSDYNFSEVAIKRDPVKISNCLLRVRLGLPTVSIISVRVTDSIGLDVLYLLKEKLLAPGTYFIKWEMGNFPEGRYWCEFNTEHFIYRKDFFIPNWNN